MPEVRVKCKLSVILGANIEGYSRLIGEVKRSIFAEAHTEGG